MQPGSDTGVSRRKVLATAGVLGAGSVAGCLGFLLDDDDDVDMEEHVDIAVGPGREDDFDPRLVHLEVGGTATFFHDSGNHDVTSFHEANDLPQRTPDGTDPFSDRINNPGDELTISFDQEGVWDVVCVRHDRVGMAMKIVAGSPDLDAEPGMESAQQGLSSSLQDRINDLNAQARALFE